MGHLDEAQMALESSTERKRPLSHYDNDNESGKATMSVTAEVLSEEKNARKKQIDEARSSFFGLSTANGGRNGGSAEAPQQLRPSQSSSAPSQQPAAAGVTLTSGSVAAPAVIEVFEEETAIPLLELATERNGGKSPSLEIYLQTTVPQNLTPQKLSGRSKPTKQSLRHSKLLVDRKFYASNQPVLDVRCRSFGKTLLNLEILLGIIILSLSAFTFFYANITTPRLNQFWLGFALVLAGWILLNLLHHRRPVRRKPRLTLVYRLAAAVLILCSIFFSILASIFASHHLILLGERDCVPENILVPHSACRCFFDSATGPNATQFEIYFTSLSCKEVDSVWQPISIANLATDVGAVLICVTFLVLFALGLRRRRSLNFKK